MTGLAAPARIPGMTSLGRRPPAGTTRPGTARTMEQRPTRTPIPALPGLIRRHRDDLRSVFRRPVFGSAETRRRVLRGDWHPLLRDPIDVLRLHYLVAAAVFFALGRRHAAWDLLFSAIAVLLVRAADPPRRFDLAFIVAMAFNGWGDALQLFAKLSWYDNLVHVTLPLAFGPLAYIALVRLDVVPAFVRENTARHRVGMAVVATALGVMGAAAYEVYEFAVDAFLGQHLFISESDTANDLFDGFVGAGIGGLLLASLARTGMPVRRGALSGGDADAPAPARDGEPRGEEGEREAGAGHERGGARGGAAQGAVEHDAGRGADRRAGEEASGADAGGAAGVVEQGGRQARGHPHERDPADPGALQAPQRAGDPGGQPPDQLGPAQHPTEPEGGQRAQRAADDRQGHADRSQQRAGDHAEGGAGHEQRGAHHPGGEERDGRPGPDGVGRLPEGADVVRQREEGEDRRAQPERDGEA
jgi:hypothetical protein